MKLFGSELLAEGESVCELMLEDLNVFILGEDGVPHIVLRFALFGHGDILGRVEGNLQRQMLDFSRCDGHLHFIIYYHIISHIIANIPFFPIYHSKYSFFFF